jgi:ketosteroid isomerase-like protein
MDPTPPASAPIPPPAADPDALEEIALDEIALARAAFVDAVKAGDVRAVADLYGEDARLLAPEAGPLSGRDDVASFWRAGVASGVNDVELEPQDIERFPTVAWEVGRYVLGLQPPIGDRVVDRGRYLLVYRLDAGRWRRAAEMFAPDAHGTDEGRRP